MLISPEDVLSQACHAPPADGPGMDEDNADAEPDAQLIWAIIGLTKVNAFRLSKHFIAFQ